MTSKQYLSVSEQEDQSVWLLVTSSGSWTPKAWQNPTFWLTLQTENFYQPLLALHFLSHKNSGSHASITTYLFENLRNQQEPSLHSPVAFKEFGMCNNATPKILICCYQETQSLLTHHAKEQERYHSPVPLRVQLGIKASEEITFY